MKKKSVCFEIREDLFECCNNFAMLNYITVTNVIENCIIHFFNKGSKINKEKYIQTLHKYINNLDASEKYVRFHVNIATEYFNLVNEAPLSNKLLLEIILDSFFNPSNESALDYYYKLSKNIRSIK